MKKASSTRWISRHVRDSHVKKAKILGYRSRAWFKIEEIVKKFNLFAMSGAIIDLGATPGGWSQFLSRHAPKNARIIACDLLPMMPLNRVYFIHGNFLMQETFDDIMNAVNGETIATIFSDMAANATGLPCVDQANAYKLLDAAWGLAQRCLNLGGQFIAKGFQGEQLNGFIKKIELSFKKIIIYKPLASRSESKEVYIVALDYRSSTGNAV